MGALDVFVRAEFAQFIDSLPDAIVVVDRHGRIALANAQTQTLFGYRRAELKGQLIEALMPARFRGHHPQHRNTFLHQPRLRPMGTGLELYGLRKDGSEFPVEISLAPVETSEGTLVVAAIRDITERKRVQEEIHRLNLSLAAEAAYRSLVEHAPYGICRIAVEEDRFYAVNPALLRMLDYESEDEVLGLSISRDVYRSPADRARQVESTRGVEEFRGLEKEWKRKDGSSLYVRLSGRRVRDDSGCEYFDMVIEDLSERRRLEEQFQQSQRLEAIARLAGGIAHDFNNLLGVITGYSWLLVKELDHEDPRREKVLGILQAASSATTLTRDLLAFSRKQTLQWSILDLNAVIGELSKLLNRVIGEDVKLVTTLAPDLGRVKLDRVGIEQVVLNLAINARDAMPGGGTLVLETANVRLDQEYASAHVGVQPGDYVMLAVKDTGEGIPAEIQSQIFDPFFTTKPAGKGTGLGLASVYGIVKQSGGHIWLYSEKGAGTTFRIYFPRVYQETERAEPAANAADFLGNETVLLVEDHPLLRKMSKEMLSGMGYTVLETEEGEQALAKAKEHPSAIHLLVTDVVMPGINGLALRDKIVELLPEIKTLFISGYSNEVVSQYGQLPAGTALLQKPFSTEALGRELRRLLDGK